MFMCYGNEEIAISIHREFSKKQVIAIDPRTRQSATRPLVLCIFLLNQAYVPIHSAHEHCAFAGVYTIYIYLLIYTLIHIIDHMIF